MKASKILYTFSLGALLPFLTPPQQSQADDILAHSQINYLVPHSLRVLPPSGTLQSFVAELLALNPSLSASPPVNGTTLDNDEQSIYVKEIFKKAERELDKIERLQDQVDFIKKLQHEVLEKALSLKGSEKADIALYLYELRTFYIRKFPQHLSHVEMRNTNFIEEESTNLQKLFMEILTQFSEGSLSDQQIATVNLHAISELFPWGDTKNISEVLRAKNNINAHFKALEDVKVEKAESLEAIIDGTFTLLKLTRNNLTFANKFTTWLSKQAEYSKGVKERERVLEKGIRKFVENNSTYLQNIPSSQRFESLLSILPAYTRLIEENSANIDFLAGAMETFKDLNKIHGHGSDILPPTNEFQEADTKLTKEMSNLFETILKNVADPNNMTKKFVFDMLHELNLLQIHKLDFIPGMLSKYCFEEGNEEWLFSFMPLTYTPNKQGEPIATLPTYLIAKLLVDNQEYFVSTTKKIIKDLEGAKTPDEEMIAMSKLSQVFEFFSPRFLSTLIYSKPDPFPSEIGKLYAKLFPSSWELIQEPIYEALLNNLKKVKVSVTTDPIRHIRRVDNRTWQRLNEIIKNTIASNPETMWRFFEAIKNRLEVEQDLYAREMLYASLGNILCAEFTGKEGNDPMSLKLIREHIKSKSLHEECRGIGKALTEGMSRERTYGTVFPNTTEERQYDYLPYLEFFKKLDDYSVGFEKLEDLRDTDKTRQTEIQRLILRSVRILEWDIDLSKQLLGIDEEAEIKDNTYDDLVRFQSNTFLMLAACAKEYPESDFKRAITQILERNFLEHATYRSYDMWEEEISALISSYSTMSKTEANDRLDHLKKVLFDNPDSLFKVYEENTFEYNLQTRKIFDNNLNVEQRKEVEKIRGETRKKVNELRLAIAKKILKDAPEAEFESFKKYLERLGYSQSEIDEALEELYKEYLKEELVKASYGYGIIFSTGIH